MKEAFYTAREDYRTTLARTALMSVLLLSGCSKKEEPAPLPASSASPAPSASVLTAVSAIPSAQPKKVKKACPSDMVKVADSYCVDRYEAAAFTPDGKQLSPYYPPHPWYALDRYKYWQETQEHDAGADETPDADLGAGGDAGTDAAYDPEKDFTTVFELALPKLPDWQENSRYSVVAVSRKGVIPSGYTSYRMAKSNCEAAGKRLCTREEWVRACRGENSTKFPYGEEYRAGVCNTMRPGHPAVQLYGRAGYHMSDPRYNLLADEGKPLLFKTGEKPECVSQWGNDGIYDMVGNLAEWVEDGREGIRGTFAGAFYSRITHQGCESKISAHAKPYYDYSIGTRCCSDTKEE